MTEIERLDQQIATRVETLDNDWREFVSTSDPDERRRIRGVIDSGCDELMSMLERRDRLRAGRQN